MTRSRVTRSSIALSSVVGVVATSAMLAPTVFAATANTWTTVAPMPTGRNRLAATTGPDGRTYALGGNNIDGLNAQNIAEAYSPATNSWSTLAPIPTARLGSAAAAGPDGRIYVMGGSDVTDHSITSVEVYTPGTNTWATAAPLPIGLQNFAAVTGLDGRIYAIGGHVFGADLNNVEAYTPSTDSWASLAPMKTPRSAFGAALGPDGRIYAIGGFNSSIGDLNTVEAYTPGTNSWATMAPMPTGLEGLSAATGPEGRIYAIGGFNGTVGTVDTVDAYNTSTNSWAPMAPLPAPNEYFAAATGSDGRIYAMGGSDTNGHTSNTVEAYTPGTNLSTTTATTPKASSIALGQSNTDTATVTGQALSGSPTGTAAFFVCGPLASAQGCATGGAAVGAPVPLTAGAGYTANAASSSFIPNAPGTWCFRAEYSGDGNYIASADGGATECFGVVAPTTYQDASPSVAYDSWQGFTDTTASGGTYRASRTKGATVTFKFSGTGITWVTRKGPASGIASVTIDGVKKGNLDLYAATAGSFSQGYSGLASKSHTIVITVTGTKNAASTNTYVNVDAFIVGLTTTQETSPKVTYDSWTGATSASASGGTYRSDGKAKATSSLTFTGMGVTWVTATGPSEGKATVTIDGVNRGTIDLYSPIVQWQVMEPYAGLASGTHTILITVLGTKDAASAGTQVVVDAFVVSS